MDASKMDVDDDGGTGAQVPADSSADDRCPICWNGITHRIKLPCSHEFCFLCAKGAVLRSSTCPMCRGAVPADFFDHCTINSENVNIATFEGTYHWYYEGRNGWWLFDSRVSQEIEEQYQKRRQRLLATATASAATTSAATTSAAIVSSSPPSAAIPTSTISNTSASRPDSTGSDLAGAVNVINLDDTDDTVDTEDTEEEDEEDVEEEEADDYDEDDDEEEEDDLDINFINALAEDEDEEADLDAPTPGVDQCEVMIAGFMYMIDFAAMIQYRRDSPSRIRRIKRDQAEANTKGIAGLRGNINFI